MAASFWARFGALLLDAIIVGISLGIITFIISGSELNKEYVTNLLSFLYSLLLPVFWDGYTCGKRICGIKIRKINDHSPPGIGTMLLRNLVAGIVYGLTAGIGVLISALMVGLREDKRAIHDFIAGTEVVYND
ncbi:RDD family protein [Paenibacillus woosongensis]|uniref:RDD family protein n=1 Tax=Paenibacillus woosongensis TaxID=307580 RepID=A0A7X3CLT9_9BACL|nr:RDD family protein [Paenibacillus woosongensis]MUG43557.1 RDD family protein [Paenibacillus woosongensis]